MKAVMVMFDSLNRHMLPPYGGDWVKAPNFARLAQRSVTFETSYVCSMPCMPARRDLHTGRPNFLHRAWGPLEPFDDSMPEMLKQAGVYTHLSTDHTHYFEDGGPNYHCRYRTWDYHRGQEGDPWMGQVADPDYHNRSNRNAGRDEHNRQDVINRQWLTTEADQPQTKTFDAGVDFIRRNHQDDKWFLQIETFDPHEPFFTQQHYQDLYEKGYRGPIADWPAYAKVSQPPDEVQHLRNQYAALMTMCDRNLGRVLDVFDELNLWDDTMLIVWTDHGFLLSEHDWWGKIRMPFYEELARTPFFVWDPRSRKAGERRKALVQPSIDLAPTLLEYFGVATTPFMTGKSLAPVIENDTPIREAGIFGVIGSQVNVTDGRYVYMRAPDPMLPLFNYTLMPAHMRGRWSVELLRPATLTHQFAFTRGAPVLKVPSTGWRPQREDWRDEDIFKSWLWDVQADPKQAQPLRDPAIEARMTALMVREMKKVEAPPELYTRLHLSH
jgi:arylsulfatase A-like enzyme